MSEYFSLKLVTPEKIYLEGQAELITVPGVEGDIGFLAQHTNFITSIRPGIIKVIRDGSYFNLLVLIAKLIYKQKNQNLKNGNGSLRKS